MSFRFSAVTALNSRIIFRISLKHFLVQLGASLITKNTIRDETDNDEEVTRKTQQSHGLN